MEIKKKMISQMVDVYVAQDDTEFFDSQECKEYEEAHELVWAGVKMFAVTENDQTSFKETINIGDADIICVSYNRQIPLVRNKLEDMGITRRGLTAKGCYVYSGYNDMWVNLEKLTESYKNILDKVKESNTDG